MAWHVMHGIYPGCYAMLLPLPVSTDPCPHTHTSLSLSHTQHASVGIEVDLFYRAQSYMFGSDSAFATILGKVGDRACVCM